MSYDIYLCLAPTVYSVLLCDIFLNYVCLYIGYDRHFYLVLEVYRLRLNVVISKYFVFYTSRDGRIFLFSFYPLKIVVKNLRLRMLYFQIWCLFDEGVNFSVLFFLWLLSEILIFQSTFDEKNIKTKSCLLANYYFSVLYIS